MAGSVTGRLADWASGCRSVAADERGATMVEAAICAPVLAFLVLGIIDTSGVLSARFRLDQALNRTIEAAASAPLTTDYSYLRAEAAEAANVPVSQVTVDQWCECNGTRQATFTTICPAGTTVARYVAVAAYLDHRPAFTYGPLGRNYAGVSADGTIRISADAAVRVQ